MKKAQCLLPIVLSVVFLASCSSSNDDDDDVTTQPAAERVTTDDFAKVECDALLSPEIVQGDLLGTDRTIECGEVSVPADWNTPEGDKITLAVYRIPATGSNPAADPLIYLEGGPGGAGVGIVGEFSTGSASYLRERSDIWVMDQRGTGYSKPALYCQEVSQADAEESDPLAAHQACYDRFVGEGVNFADYNSANNAKDVDAVRVALGYDEWNLYGLSYGTRLALTVMRDKPEHVRSVVLDSVFPIEVNGLSESSYPVYWAIEQIGINCAADDDCTENVGNLQEVIEAGIARLDANPVGALTADAYLQMLGSQIADAEVASIAFLIANGSDSDLQELMAQLAEGEEEEESPNLSEYPPVIYPFLADTAEGMYYAVVCAEEAAYKDIKGGPDISAGFSATTQQIVSRLTDPASDYLLCDNVYNVPAAGDIETKAVNSAIPTMVLAGTADIATPPSWSLLADEALTNSQYAEFAGLTHGLIGNNDCLNQMTMSFLNDPSATADQSCIVDLDGVDYVFE